jgi:hypothetical protein
MQTDIQERYANAIRPVTSNKKLRPGVDLLLYVKN